MVHLALFSGLDDLSLSGVGPIHGSVNSKNVECVKLLLDHDPSLIEYTSPTVGMYYCFPFPFVTCGSSGAPLHVACEEECLEIVNFLLERGANVNVKHPET